MTNQNISSTDPRRYWTQLPNIVDDSDLDLSEFRLLVHYYRVGNCWESTSTTAEKTNLSVRTVREKRKSLSRKGWIALSTSDSSTVSVQVVDKWQENIETYAPKNQQPTGEANFAGGAKILQGGGQNLPPKKNLLKKNKEINNQGESKSKFDQPEFELLSLWLKVTSNRELDYVGSQERKMAKHCQRLLDVMEGDIDLSIKLLKNQWISKREAGLHYHTIKRFDDYVDFVIQDRLHPAVDPPTPAPHYSNPNRPQAKPMDVQANEYGIV